MRHFIAQLFIYFFWTTFLICFVILVINKLVTEKAICKINGNAKYIILGHSHPECAFNDSLISNFSNQAKSGESYFYTDVKAKMLLSQNKNIETVFIEFGNNQIDQSKDEWIWGDNYMPSKYKIYSPFMTIEENEILLRNNFLGLINCISIATKYNFQNLIHNDLTYQDRLGGYLYLNKNKVDSFLLAVRTYQKPDATSPKKISYININYLEKLVSLCAEKNKQIYFVRSPVHNKYPALGNEIIFKEILTSKFRSIEFLDFVKFPLLNSEYADLEHLNFHGAKKFSMWFNQLLKDSLLSKSNKQEFINNRIEELNNK